MTIGQLLRFARRMKHAGMPTQLRRDIIETSEPAANRVAYILNSITVFETWPPN